MQYPKCFGTRHPLRAELRRLRTRRTPEDKMIARSELGDVYSLLGEITAALHSVDPDAEVTDEQIQNTRYWMLVGRQSPLDETAP